MKIHAILATAVVLVAAIAAGSAAGAGTSTTALVNCGKVTAGGKSWRLGAAAVSCITARKVVREVAVKKPDHVIRAHGGEIDQYKASFSGLKCFKGQKSNVGGEIQCTSRDGKRNVLAVTR